MYSRIIVPLDGSELAEAAIDYSKELASRSNASLVVLHVCKPEEQQYMPMHRRYAEHIVETLKQDLIKTGTAGVEVESAISVGDPAAEILHLVEENDFSLIVMSTHGLSGVGRWALGSVSDKVVRHSPIPVLLIRSVAPESADKKMLVLLDGSQLSEQVIPYAINHAKTSDAELTLLRVFDSPYILSDYPEGTARLSWEEHVEQITAKYKRECSIYLEELAGQLEAEGLNVKVEVLLGKADEETVGYLDKTEVGLVTMTTHGRSGIRRWALGSIAEKVVHGSSRPVLLVRAH